MHDEAERLACAGLTAPLEDVFDGLGIEVALAKRRRVHRVEQLPHFRDAQLEHRASFRRVRGR